MDRAQKLQKEQVKVLELLEKAKSEGDPDIQKALRTQASMHEDLAQGLKQEINGSYAY